MRGVDQQNVNACGNQRVNTLFVTRTRANRCTNTQTALLVFTGVRFTFRFLEVFHGDHADQVEFVINHQRFFNAFFVHFCQHNFTGFTFTHGDQTFFRRHVNANRLAQVGNKTYVTTGDNTHQFVFFGNDRVARKAVTLGQFFHFAQRRGWQNSLRVSHHARFVFFHTANFFRLAFNGHIFVDKADTAFLSQSNSQARFRYGIHCCGKHRDIQTNSFRQLGAEVSSIRQNGRMSRNEENVVKRQSFFSDT